MTIRQVAASIDHSDFMDEILTLGLAFVGRQRQVQTITKVEPDDQLVLRRGGSQMEANGQVFIRGSIHCRSGDKHWLHDFDGCELVAYL